MALSLRPDVSAPVFPGLYAAKVEKVEDDDNLGRIVVSIPSVFGDVTTDLQVTARPCFTYGHFFVPEKGDEVWVAFENGDPTAPVWLGVVYTPGSPPAESKAKPPTKRVVKTKAGHLLLLDDESGKETIEIKEGKGGNSVKLTSDEVTLSHASGHKVVLGKSSISIEVSGGGKLSLTSSGAEVSGGGAKVALSSSGVEVTGSEIKLSSSSVLLGTSATLAVARVTDQGIGNFGAPVTINPPGSTAAKA
jgi:phage baseplate assembly protein gpV